MTHYASIERLGLYGQAPVARVRSSCAFLSRRAASRWQAAQDFDISEEICVNSAGRPITAGWRSIPILRGPAWLCVPLLPLMSFRWWRMRRTFPSKVIGRSRLVGRYRLVVQELPPTAILRVKSEHPNSWQHAQPHAATMYCVSIASMRSRQVMGCRRRAHRHYSAGVCFCRCV